MLLGYQNQEDCDGIIGCARK